MNKAQQHSIAVPVKRRPNLTVAPFEGFDRAASLAVPQELIDDLLREFTEGELKVALILMRATHGGQREHVPLSVRMLCNGGIPDVPSSRGTGLSARTVQAACAALETAGYIRLLRRTAPDGSGLPSLFSLPLLTPGVSQQSRESTKFPGYAARRVRIPFMVLDKIMPDLSGAEFKVLLYVLRHTFSVGSPDEIIPMARLVENTGVSLRHARLAIHSLTARGFLLVRHRQDPERGKLPSQFGVRVLGEPEPFMPPPVLQKESSEEPTRSIWLVPHSHESAAAEVSDSGPSDRSNSQLLTLVPTQDSPAIAVTEASLNAPSESKDERSSVPGPSRRQVDEALTEDPDPIWGAVKKILATRLPYHHFIDRIAFTHSIHTDPDGTLLIAVQNEHHRWWMEDKFGLHIATALADAGYADQKIRYSTFTGARP